MEVNMAEDVLEEVELVTLTDEDGHEEYYMEDLTIEYDGKTFAVLIPYIEGEDDVIPDGEEVDIDAIIAKMEDEAGEVVYVAPTDDEFDAVSKIYNEMLQDMQE